MPEFKSAEQLRAEALLEKKDKLRDKFAAAALTGLLASGCNEDAGGPLLAYSAYTIAYALLQEKLNNPLK